MCGNRYFRILWDSLSSPFASSSAQVVTLTKREKKLLINIWPLLKERNPDLFLRAWIKSAQMSVNIKKAVGLREDEAPESNERFISLSPYIEKFVDKLVTEFHCNDAKIAESCTKLGARHLNYSDFHTNFWDIYLGNLVQGISDMNWEHNTQETTAICEKFFHFFVNFMRDGYNKRVQEVIMSQKKRSQA